MKCDKCGQEIRFTAGQIVRLKRSPLKRGVIVSPVVARVLARHYEIEDVDNIMLFRVIGIGDGLSYTWSVNEIEAEK